jgi:hypothetical protein
MKMILVVDERKARQAIETPVAPRDGDARK